MILQLSTWLEIAGFLDSCRTIVIPIGSNEQHGPTGLLGTDWLCPEVIAHQAHADGAEILVGPTFNIGMAQHHLAFPGTISLRPSTMILAIRDWVSSLVGQGFETIYFLNGHGGNVATIEAAFSELYAESSYGRRRAGFALVLRNWWQLPGIEDLARAQFPTGHGSHATPSEIAITQAAFPGSIKTADYDPPVAPNGPIRDAADFRSRHPDGRMGSDPRQAAPDHGRALIALAAQGLAAEVSALSARAEPD